MNQGSLKLRGQDAEDIEVIAAVLQDAIAPICDMTFQDTDQSFIMVVHRFCWCEAEGESKPCYQRVCCAVTVGGVSGVQVQGIDQKDQKQMLDLLTVELQDKTLVFIFAGEARIKLALGDGWKVKLADFGEPWPTAHCPSHST
jgi:hypothetical protein